MKGKNRPTQGEILNREASAYVDGLSHGAGRRIEIQSEEGIEALAQEHRNYYEWLVGQVGCNPLQQDEEAGLMESGVALSYPEAKEAPDGVLVMQGDWGGQIYLSCPMKQVKCDEGVLAQLLRDLDRLAWSCNEGDGTDAYYLRRVRGQGIWGGMGGGVVRDGLWTHEEFVPLRDAIWEVIQGKSKKIKDEDLRRFVSRYANLMEQLKGQLLE